MKIIGTAENGGSIVEMTEKEIEQVTGVEGKAKKDGRFKPGVEVNISPVYKKIKKVNEGQAGIATAIDALITSANDIKYNIDLINGE